jgi:ABC-type branched-subunit amino acid transport system substrate-binding protein
VAPFEPGGDDTAGVTDDEIVIGIHAPVTGASPIPQTSFDIGKDIYWNFLAEAAPDTLFGRTVRVVFRDDEFNPQNAVQVCREMVEDEGAFLLVGGGGADQITACAQYASENGIPYVSAGVNENVLSDLETYFATTLTYAEQAPLLMGQLQAQSVTEIGLVVSDTPSFDDALEAIKAAAEEAGIPIAFETRINKTAAEPEQLSVVQELKNSGVEAVILLSSPVVFIGLANQGLNQSFTPIWLGPGVTSGLNAVTTFGCPAVDTGVFFSPTPGLDVIDQLDPDFNPAYVQFGGGAAADDIGLQLWSLNKALGLMLAATGPELGRAAFMNTLVTTPSFENAIYAPVEFTVDDHFGGTGAHLLDADCALEPKQFTTAEQFVAAG